MTLNYLYQSTTSGYVIYFLTPVPYYYQAAW